MVYLRKFVAMDGAHCTFCHQFILLMVIFLNGEEEILILIWALIPVEDWLNWLWFLQKIGPYLIAIQDWDVIIISNWLKWITSVVTEYFLYSTHSNDSKYLCDNIRTSYREIMFQKFWGCVYVKSESTFDKVLEEMKKIIKNAAKDISNLSQYWCSPYVIKLSRYGQII